MPSNTITRDHHNLRRNLNLNDKYISNDGGDEGIRITDAGLVGIGVADPDTPLEILNTSAQLKLSYDTDSFATMETNSASSLSITAAESGNVQLYGNSIVFGNNAGGNILAASTTDSGATLTANVASGMSLVAVFNPSSDIKMKTSGVVWIDKDWSTTTTSTEPAFQIDYDTTGIVASGQTLTSIGADININCESVTHVGTVNQTGIDIDMVAATDGTQSNVGIDINVSGADTNTGMLITQTAGDHLILARDSTNTCTFTVAADGATTIATADSDGAAGHLTLDVDGHVEFDGCGVGFDKETTTFAAAAVTSEGDDSTDIDFREGNKHELTLTDDLAGSGENINLIFPATSGNFLLTLIQGAANCTIASTAWQAYASDETLCDNLAGQNLPDGRVRWGSVGAPTLSTSQYEIDIVSFYWDADNQTAFGVINQGF